MKTPVSKSFSPRPYIVVGYMTVFLGFGIFGTWAATAPLASGVVARGVISIEGNRKVIQHLEGGIIADIPVKEGDVVNQGDVLAKLDKTSANGNYTVWATKLMYLKAAEARLLAESLNKDDITFPDDVVNNTIIETKSAITLQKSLFQDRIKSRDGKVAIFQARIAQISEVIKGLEDQIKAIDKQISSMDLERERLDQGMKLGVVSENQLAQLTRNFLDLQSRRGQITAEIARNTQSVSENELQIVQTKQEYVERAVSEHKDVLDQMSEVGERTRVAADILARTTIISPVRGKVQNIRFHTTDGVVRPAEPIMDIIPLDSDLMISAQILPIDIDNVSVGAQVTVGFSAFSAKRTPIIFGKVTVLSKDVVEPTSAGQQPYYLAYVKVDDQDLPPEIKGRLVAGMPVDVVVSTGSRTFVEYLTKPLVDTFYKSMKEK